MSEDAYRGPADRYLTLSSEVLRQSGDVGRYGCEPEMKTQGLAVAHLMGTRDRLAERDVVVIPDSIEVFSADLLWGYRFEGVELAPDSLWHHHLATVRPGTAVARW